MRAKSEKAKWQLEGKLLPFSGFFFSLWFFFSYFPLLEKKKMLGKSVWNRRAEVRGQHGSLKESSFASLHFFSSLWFFFFSSTWKEEDAMRKLLKQKDRNGKAKAGAKSEKAEWELEGKNLSFSTFLFFSMIFFSMFFFSYLKRRRCKEKVFEIEG